MASLSLPPVSPSPLSSPPPKHFISLPSNSNVIMLITLGSITLVTVLGVVFNQVIFFLDSIEQLEGFRNFLRASEIRTVSNPTQNQTRNQNRNQTQNQTRNQNRNQAQNGPSRKWRRLYHNMIFVYEVGRSKGFIGRDITCCAICLEDYKRRDKCRVLCKCKHVYHKECIDMWLLRDRHCPVCRGYVDGLRTRVRIIEE